MPLHDWTNRPGWEGVHHLWISELLRWLKPRLPEGFRAYIGSAPVLAIGAPERPDVGDRHWTSDADATPTQATDSNDATCDDPEEEIAVATLEPNHSLLVERHGRLAAALEVISPRNKDRPAARMSYAMRYAAYLLDGVHLLVVDVHQRPLEFSFADEIANQLQIKHAHIPTPLAISYRVGEPAATGGRLLGMWKRPLVANELLPAIPLALSLDQVMSVDLEETYQRAAADAYLT